MPRKLRPELEALIATGKYGMHTTHDILLTDGSDFFLSSGQILVNSLDKTQQYVSLLDDVQSLQMSLSIEADMQQFNITNVDKVIGQTLTTDVRQLDGAKTIIGAIFIDNLKTYLPENFFWDARMRCELLSGEVSDKSVDFSATSEIDSVLISGRLIVEEFSWREPIHSAPEFNPNDLISTGPTNGLDINGRGRYGDLDFPVLGHGLLM